MNHGHVKPRAWTLFYSGISGHGHIHSASQSQDGEDDVYYDVVEHSAYQAALDEIEKLRTEIEFVKQYLNTRDTSFRKMIDVFKVLPKDKQNKLIALLKSLTDLQESEARFPKGEK